MVALLKSLKGQTLGINLNVYEKKDPKEPWRAQVNFISPDGKPGDPFQIIVGYDSPDVYFEINDQGYKARFDGQQTGNQIKGTWNMMAQTEQGGMIEFLGGTWQATKQ